MLRFCVMMATRIIHVHELESIFSDFAFFGGSFLGVAVVLAIVYGYPRRRLEQSPCVSNDDKKKASPYTERCW